MGVFLILGERKKAFMRETYHNRFRACFSTERRLASPPPLRQRCGQFQPMVGIELQGNVFFMFPALRPPPPDCDSK
jgi:hypothetical protein